jgi:enoyl-ACP reductase-like protein
VIATGRIMATVIPGSIQSNRDRAELVALRRLGTIEDCAKVVEFLATDLSDYVTGVIPIDGGLRRGLRASGENVTRRFPRIFPGSLRFVLGVCVLFCP